MDGNYYYMYTYRLVYLFVIVINTNYNYGQQVDKHYFILPLFKMKLLCALDLYYTIISV